MGLQTVRPQLVTEQHQSWEKISTYVIFQDTKTQQTYYIKDNNKQEMTEE